MDLLTKNSALIAELKWKRKMTRTMMETLTPTKFQINQIIRLCLMLPISLVHTGPEMLPQTYLLLQLVVLVFRHHPSLPFGMMSASSAGSRPSALPSSYQSTVNASAAASVYTNTLSAVANQAASLGIPAG
ncbi:uncharacterized protein, partial [Diabrotica undecimpunctata]|uniref:uncharacterized protein n=1 Tax=Diabrotica undecimpunctata TaxID=50387 RepID=UPI003B63EC6F